MSLMTLPRELRDMIMATVIVNDQPFRIKSTITKHDLVSRSANGVHQSCRQIRAEYAQLLRRAAFTPGTKTVAPVYDFQFGEMISFVKTLKSHEIVAANRNRNLVINLFVFDVKALEAKRLLEWVRLCEATGLQVSYILQWTAHDVSKVKAIDAAIGGYREGKKILKALKARSIASWSWESYTSDLKQHD